MVCIKPIFKKIYKKIKEYDEIVIARHVGPDPDAVASQIALRDTIKATFPNKKVYAVGKSVSKFKYFGLLDKIDTLTLNNPLLIVLDVPNIYRIDVLDVKEFKDILKIDHHPYEDYMGEVEWVDDTASSTCQMIVELIFNTKLKLTNNVAENLFMGIVSDSDRFLLSYTSKKTFELVTKLLEKTNIQFQSLYHYLYERPLAEIKFHGFLSQNLVVSENGLGYVKINNEIINEYAVDFATASNMINDFNFIKGVYAWLFITYDEKNNLFKVNIRSRGPIINEIAARYGGGGHKFASGVRTNSEEDINNLINDLDEVCLEYKKELND